MNQPVDSFATLFVAVDIVAGQMDCFDLHVVKEPRAVGVLRHIPRGPKVFVRESPDYMLDKLLG